MITFASSLSGHVIGVVSGDESSNNEFGPTAYVIYGSGVNITIDGSNAPRLIINGADGALPVRRRGGRYTHARKPDP